MSGFHRTVSQLCVDILRRDFTERIASPYCTVVYFSVSGKTVIQFTWSANGQLPLSPVIVHQNNAVGGQSAVMATGCDEVEAKGLRKQELRRLKNK